MEKKPFSIGLRIEHPQALIDMAQYGQPAEVLGLPPAEYKLSYHCTGDGPAQGRGVYTFCMCPGGRVIVASSEAGGIVVNGMSDHARDSGMANSALLCDVRVSDFPGGADGDVLAGMEMQRRYEQLAYRVTQGIPPHPYVPPRATWAALRDGAAPAVEACLPPFAMAAFREAMPVLGRKLAGFDNPDALLTAVETRSSSPVRILRSKTGEGRLSGMRDTEVLTGFYPCGEGAGYAGGITSAAVDGIRAAEQIIERWLPPTLSTGSDCGPSSPPAAAVP